MAHRRNKSYLSTCCQKMSLPYQIGKMIPEGELLEGGKRRGNIQQCAFSPARTHTHTHTPTQIHWRDMELLSVDKQMTDKWHVGTPPPGLIVIALWDCANGISYGEKEREGRGGERGLCVILHKQNLCQTPDVIASTAVNCVQSNLSVNLGCREWGHG